MPPPAPSSSTCRNSSSLEGTLSGTLGGAAIHENWIVNAADQQVTVDGSVGKLEGASAVEP